MIHRTELPIRTFHTDAFGHVNNSRYLELLEEARWRYAEHIGLIELMRAESLGFIIVDLKMRFRKPVVEGQVVSIETSLATLGTASGDVNQQVYVRSADDSAKPSPAVKGSFHFILIERATGKSVPIAGKIRDCLSKVIESN
ncbi:MAG: thioesterase family protein [Planctomycetota bacterium]